MSLKQVKITLANSAVTTERGALYFHKGKISAQNVIPEELEDLLKNNKKQTD
jgi:hypothetical protein